MFKCARNLQTRLLASVQPILSENFGHAIEQVAGKFLFGVAFRGFFCGSHRALSFDRWRFISLVGKVFPDIPATTQG